MKNYEIQFKNNQCIIVATNKVLHLKPGATFFISGDDANFVEKDFLDQHIKPLDSQYKLETLQKKHKKDHLELLAAANTEFYFKFGLGKHTVEENIYDSFYIFKAKILEDLYIYTKQNKDQSNKNNWRMCNCASELGEVVAGKLNFDFEKLQANSLSELTAILISTYFNRKRSTSFNAFKTFYFAGNTTNPSKDWFKNNQKQSLDFKRIVANANLKAIEIKKKQSEI